MAKSDLEFAKPVKKKTNGKYFSSEYQAKETTGHVVKTIDILGQTNQLNAKVKLGRPTKYRPIYCKQIVEYFLNAQPIVAIVDDPGGKGGTNTHLETLRIPTIKGFASRIGVNQDTLYEWASVHAQFSDAFDRARALQSGLIEELGLAGRLGKGIAELYFINHLGYKDSKHMDITTDGKALPQPITALQLNVNSPTQQKAIEEKN